MIRVLIVDDSHTARLLVQRALESVPDIRVVGTARDGGEAVTLTRDLRPDVITMDVRMPMMDGLQATEQIMAHYPTPIVVVSSSVDAKNLETTFHALRVGALEVIEKPSIPDESGFDGIRRRLVDTVRAMSEVRVVRRRSQGKEPVLSPPPHRAHVIAIGASTGGPQLLGEIFSKLPATFPCPILVVQHMSPGFTAGLVNWLGKETALPVKLAQAGEGLVPQTIYFAPDGRHLRIDSRWKIVLGDDPPLGQFRPAVDALFTSVASVAGASGAGVLLTGMGHDGAAGLKAMRDAGGWTIVQRSETCVVAGMPDSARAVGAALQVLAPDDIPSTLLSLAERRTA